MNFPEASMIRAPDGGAHFARVPAHTIRPSRTTMDEFGVEPLRGSTSVPPTRATALDCADAIVPARADSIASVRMVLVIRSRSASLWENLQRRHDDTIGLACRLALHPEWC